MSDPGMFIWAAARRSGASHLELAAARALLIRLHPDSFTAEQRAAALEPISVPSPDDPDAEPSLVDAALVPITNPLLRAAVGLAAIGQETTGLPAVEVALPEPEAALSQQEPIAVEALEALEALEAPIEPELAQDPVPRAPSRSKKRTKG